MLADGQLATVIESKRVYKTDKALKGWINSQSESGGGPGLEIDFADQKIKPCVSIHAWSLVPGRHADYGYVVNYNDSFCNDTPFEPCPESWYISKVYNMEVEDCYTYFVDKLGVWVHNTNC